LASLREDLMAAAAALEDAAQRRDNDE